MKKRNEFINELKVRIVLVLNAISYMQLSNKLNQN